MRLLRQAHQVGADIRPALSGIVGPHHAVDFQSTIDRARLRRVLRHPHHAAGERHHRAIGHAGIGHGLPGLTAILAAIDRDRRPARKHPLRIRCVHQERPDLPTILGKIRARAGFAGVRAAIHAVRRASEYDVRIGRVDMHRPALVILDHVAPAFRPTRAAEHPDNAALIGPPDITSDAGIQIRLTRHGSLPLNSLHQARYASSGVLANRTMVG